MNRDCRWHLVATGSVSDIGNFHILAMAFWAEVLDPIHKMRQCLCAPNMVPVAEAWKDLGQAFHDNTKWAQTIKVTSQSDATFVAQ